MYSAPVYYLELQTEMNCTDRMIGSLQLQEGCLHVHFRLHLKVIQLTPLLQFII